MKPSPSGLTRRGLLTSSAALGLTLLFRGRTTRAAPASKPKFLLHIMVPGGLDSTMLFDARPRAMTAAGKIHNPLGQEPMVWTGTNGTEALSASTAAPLQAIRDRFSVINGIVMSTNFDGHDQNTNLFLTGNPFGGRSFNSDLNAGGASPLDYVRMGETFATVEDSRNVALTPGGLRELAGGVRSLSSLSPSVDSFLGAETEALGDPTDRFGAGVIGLGAATSASDVLRRKMQDIVLVDKADRLEGQLDVIREVFRLGIARGAMFAIGDDDQIFQFDTHASDQAKQQGPLYLQLATRLARVFGFLAETPFDGSTSLLDVTTVVVGAEFGRTMRQIGVPITDTGTDHNPLSNSVLIGGAGINSGLVVGASDFRTHTEVLSPTHLTADPDQVKTMGRPFDFETCQPRTDLPATFVPGDYLQIASVINTILSVFDIEKSQWRPVERNGATAPVLTTLLA